MMLSGSTGERVEGRHVDARPGAQLLSDDLYVLTTGRDHLEAWRFDLVRTVEYGVVPAPEQNGQQPRTGCTYGSFSLGGRRTAVIEQCPGEATSRLTALTTDGDLGSEVPDVRYSLLLPDARATIIAITENRVAVALPGRMIVLDGSGTQIAVTEMQEDMGVLPAGVARTITDNRFLFWFTGSSVVALDAIELAPLWTFPGALGPPVRFGVDLLVPVRDGFQELTDRGEPGRLIPVVRADPDALVLPDVLGDVVLEQRGAELVALRPV
jgi:hypothetical protein